MPVLALVRDGRLHRFDDSEAKELRAGDRVICVKPKDHA